MIIQTKELTKTFGETVAVNHINMSIHEGSLTAILGPNGAGKTTTMSMLTGLLKPTSGTIGLNADTKISMVFQQSILDKQLSAYENLVIRSHMYQPAATDHLAFLIEKIGLKPFIKQKYGSLSGGQKRRVDIARALINQPDILFLDEPTTGLDIQTRAAIWNLLHFLQKNRGLTVVLTTHYLEEADHADEVYIIDHGTVIAEGLAATIRERYSKNQLTLRSSDPQKIIKQISTTMKFVQDKEAIVCFPTSTTATIDLLAKFPNDLSGFEYRPGTMDDAFLNLTGREMR